MVITQKKIENSLMENINLSTVNGKRNNNNCIGRKRSLALALKAKLETEIEQEIILISSTTFQVSGTKVLTLIDNHSAVSSNLVRIAMVSSMLMLMAELRASPL